MDYAGSIDENDEQTADMNWRTDARGWESDYYDRNFSPLELRQSLRPLLLQLQRYDKLRMKLQQQGGDVSELQELTHILREKIEFKEYRRDDQVALTEQASLRAALRAMDYDLYLAVRRLATGMPAYYLCRIKRGYWADYSLIVEDYYRSPDYPLADERFVQLMYLGHETLHLRLAQFRDEVGQLLRREESDEQRLAQQTDQLLYQLGRHIFQAAWHEDQQIAVLIAEHFQLPQFRSAIELLYLCLSSELCELRGALNPAIMEFFERGYWQTAISSMLRKLNEMDGEQINQLPQSALQLYARLSHAFGSFLQTEVRWGHRQVQVPLWQLVFGNALRLQQVSQPLAQNKKITAAARQLEQEARAIIEEITAS